MGFFNKLFGKKDTVLVTFINVSDGKAFASSNMPSDQLPESFEHETRMTLEGVEWSVVEADPVHSSDFIKKGQLTLKMSKIEYMDPKELLYSLPSIANELPATFKPVSTIGNPYVISEDDWRQLEFFNPSSLPLIEQELEAINQVKESSSVDLEDSMLAFSDCHVRASIGGPNLKVKLADLLEELGSSQLEHLKFNNTDTYVKNGFAASTPHSTYYGLEENGLISELCVGNPSEGTSEEINRVLQRFNLLFVNWYHSQVISKES